MIRFGSKLAKTFVLFFFAFELSACTTLQKPFFWKIEKDGKTSYILGTIHMGVVTDDLPKYVFKAFDESNIFATEVDMAEIERKVLARAMNASGSFTEKTSTGNEWVVADGEPTTNQLVSPEVWAEVKKVLNTIPSDKLKYFRPEILAFVYWAHKDKNEDVIRVSRYEYNRLDPNNSMDLDLFRYARKKSITTGHLEKMDAYKKPDGCRNVMGVLLLENAVQHHEPPIRSLERLVDAYRSGDGTKVLAEIGTGDEGLGHRCLLKARNENWVSEIARFHETVGPAFIAVGAAHMLTPKDSLLDLLRARGFTIERVEGK